MYQCPKCDRKYASQNSLTRHVHSHSKSQKHRCTVCGVTFYRRDLLSRHSKLHELASPSTDQAHPAQADTDAHRKRCHTACIRCRELRTKCNSQRPCTSCVNAEAHCEDSRHSNRLSRLSFQSEHSSFISTSEADFGDLSSALEQEQQDSEPSEETPSAPEHLSLAVPSLEGGEVNRNIGQMDFQSPLHPSTTQEQGFPLQMDYTLPETMDGGAILGSLDSSVAVPSMDTISWPWLHENLYLRPSRDAFSDSYDAFGLQYFGDNSLLAPMEYPMLQLGTSQVNHATAVPTMLSDHQTRQENISGNECDAEAVAEADAHANSMSSTPLPTFGHAAISHENHTVQEIRPQSLATQQTATPRSSRCQVVRDLVAFASGPQSHVRRNADCASSWQLMSPKVAEAFDIPVEKGVSASSTLYRFYGLYCANFGPLWPLLSPQNTEADALHPLLFLTLTSIGSMYGGPAASNFGAMMHARIRVSLCAVLDFDDAEADSLWLAQARLLTQVAALYFGQPKAFSYSQHLGTILIAQARRMDLFSAKPAENFIAKFYRLKGVASDQERLSIWLQVEARRRLAFGIFRADTYTSVLLHTRPLVLLEEIDLEFPMCDAVWRGERMPPSLCLQMIERERTPGRQMRASDIYRIAIDKHEDAVPLDPCGQELLMFGLQYQAWRFSHDQKMFARLTDDHTQQFDELNDEQLRGVESTASKPPPPTHPARSPFQASTRGLEIHSIDSASRTMADLKYERDRLIAALDKWQRALSLVKALARTELDRSSLLSSLIIYHLVHLCLHAPLQDIHQIQYVQADNRVVGHDLVTELHRWANSRRGRLAAERACIIWALIAREAQITDDGKRVRFNLLAFAGLHHAAVLLWAYVGAHDFDRDHDAGNAPLMLEAHSASKPAIPVDQSHCAEMMNSFVELYDRISPARWSSFAKVASRLATQRSPVNQRIE
ncbi:uncharacterized protein Z520_11603 [Fonsecaea multimorphosa CBS 102226]|uniref:C2H2-type domain-containing protein n=1 Tax=Fonsecaea multimorphosa CBS 102226 TaxID=1442371 RepID=A0A0D2I688_9EURO|nr:uncharacterized protein Z520_11603 [Fonsecaea multimorphosa CBS 102226]KIX92751.1 hypothetical protein Z520_11603 [Fonsecaea multimorphosa CBS 102226]